MPIIPALMAVGTLLGTGSIFYGAWAMQDWSRENIQQTSTISEDRSLQRELDYAKLFQRRYELEQDIREWEYTLEHGGTQSDYYNLQKSRNEYEQLNDQLNRQFGLQQSSLIGEYDLERERIQSSTSKDISQLQSHTDVNIYEAKMRQLEKDSNDFLLDKSFDASSKSDIFGEPESMTQVAYILAQLLKLKNQDNQRPVYNFEPNFQDDNLENYTFITNSLN